MSKRTAFMLIFAIIAFSVVLTDASAMNITREMPSRIEPGSLFDTNITIVVDVINMSASYVEDIPADFIFNSWQINGTKESVNDILVKVSGTKYTWNFTPTENKVKITYYLLAPDAKGDYAFSGTSSDGTNTASSYYSTTIGKVGCGNNLCETSENSTSCPSDCAIVTSLVAPQSQTNTVRTVTTTTTTTTSSGSTADDIFAQKKSSSSSTKLFVILLATVAVLGLTGYGMYMQMQRKKGKAPDSAASGNLFGRGKGFSFFGKGNKNSNDIFSGVKDAIDKFGTKSNEESENQKQMAKKEHVEVVSSELPSFTESQSKFEIPSMPSEVRKDQNVVLSIPPIPKRRTMMQRRPLTAGLQMKPVKTNVQRISAKPLPTQQKPVVQSVQKPKQQPNQPQKSVSEDDVDDALDNIMKEKRQKNN